MPYSSKNPAVQHKKMNLLEKNMIITPYHACRSIASTQASSHLFRRTNDSSAAQSLFWRTNVSSAAQMSHSRTNISSDVQTSHQPHRRLFTSTNDSLAAQTSLQPPRRFLSRTNKLCQLKSYQSRHATIQGFRSSAHHHLCSSSMPAVWLNTTSGQSSSSGCHASQLLLSTGHRLLLAAA